MVSRSGANCPTDAAAKSTMKQTKAETHAKPDKGEAAVAASPSDPKVKEEKESKREVHQRKAERKPAVAASHSERARPHTNTQAQDSTSCEYTSYSGAESSSSDASSSRDRSTSSDVGSPSLDNDRRHRVSRSKYRTRRRSGGHGKRYQTKQYGYYCHGETKGCVDGVAPACGITAFLVAHTQNARNAKVQI